MRARVWVGKWVGRGTRVCASTCGCAGLGWLGDAGDLEQVIEDFITRCTHLLANKI